LAATAFSTTSTAALPTTTPSAKLATARAAPGVRMPKPTATGSLPPVRARIASTFARGSSMLAKRGAVMPVSDT
jgi:hypothetical protein